MYDPDMAAGIFPGDAHPANDMKEINQWMAIRKHQ